MVGGVRIDSSEKSLSFTKEFVKAFWSWRALSLNDFVLLTRLARLRK
jgi:hypothetical protein